MDTNEVRIARQLFNRTENKAVKEVLGQFNDSCPRCRAEREDWKMLVPIEEVNDSYHLVSYECSCGKQFKKMEVADDEF